MADGRVTSRIPRVNLAAMQAGDPSALAGALAARAFAWFRAAGSDLAVPTTAVGVALSGDTARAGVLACASDLRGLLAQSP